MSKIESRLAGTRVPFGLPVFTLATRPNLSANDTGRQIYVADAPTGQRIQVWTGTTWEAPIAGASFRAYRATWSTGQSTINLPWTPRGDVAVFVVAKAEFLVEGGGNDYTVAGAVLTLTAAGQAKLANNDVLLIVGAESASGGSLNSIQSFVIAASDETSNLTTGTAKVTFRMPYAFTPTAVRASLSTASSSGPVVVDIRKNGASIMGSNKLSIDDNERTSTTAATQPNLVDTNLGDDAEISIDITSAGTGAKGLKVTLIGYPT
ncbi:hypothetical protein [Meiothermus taiwanensis]|uniref:Uncharacterized protein n=1 Tax=Meiothermus taiwanensis WR-220 TaxID=1339250 RepID=A0ABN5LVE9_9DEIN|nr:hypothetical protein [Meiothermus taiwanensis]AWR86266.1 hypothetical protein Mtai_v1c10220 [Meiothermus taiwanensis WR-220]